MRAISEVVALCAAGLIPNLAYLAIGLPLRRWLRLDVPITEGLAISYLLGTGTASIAILCMRAANLPVSVLGLCAAGLGGLGLALLATTSQSRPIRETPLALGWVRAIDLASIAVAGLLFASALGPEVGWDSLEYHLPIIRAWSEGPIRALPGVLDAEFRSGADLLYLPAVTAQQSDAAAGVSACFAAALAALVRAEAARRSSRGAGAWAGLLVLLAPLCLETSITADVDLAVGAYGFLALSSANRWNRGSDRRFLLLSVVVLAFAANAKLHAAILVPAVALLLLAGGRVPKLSDWLRGSTLVALLTLPWFIKAALTTGNPLFPLFGALLGYGPTTAEHLAGRRTTLLQAFPTPSGPSGLLHWLAFVTLGSKTSGGSLLGPLPLALVPIALARVSRATLALCAVLTLLVVLQFEFMRPVRFGVPIWAFVAIAAAIGGTRLANSSGVAATAVAVALIGSAAFGTSNLLPTSIERVAAIASPESFRARAWPDQIALRELVQLANGPVAISMGAALWMEKPVYNLHWERNGELFFRGSPPETVHALLLERGIQSVVVTVSSPLPSDGRVGHPTVDAWIESGRAVLRADVPPRIKRGDRVWVLVELR